MGILPTVRSYDQTYKLNVFLSFLGVTLQLLVATSLVIGRPHAEVMDHLTNRMSHKTVT